MIAMRDTLRMLSTRLRGNPSRVFLAFALGIVLPSAFLSYLGFRSLNTEEKLLRNEAQERYQEAATSLQRLSMGTLRAPLSTLVDIAASEPFLREELPGISRRLFALREIGGAHVEN